MSIANSNLSVGSITIYGNGGAFSTSGFKNGGLITKVDPPPAPCRKRRGGPRSKVFCAVYSNVPHEVHTGRTPAGKWITWEDNNGA